jgi:hypothetical protein
MDMRGPRCRSVTGRHLSQLWRFSAAHRIRIQHPNISRASRLERKQPTSVRNHVSASYDNDADVGFFSKQCYITLIRPLIRIRIWSRRPF